MKQTLEQIEGQIRDLIALRFKLTGVKQSDYVIMEYVSAVAGITSQDILSGKTDRRTSDARKIVVAKMYEAGYTKTIISKKLGRSYAQIIYLLNQYKHLSERDYDFRQMINQFNEAWKTHSNSLSQLQSSQAT